MADSSTFTTEPIATAVNDARRAVYVVFIGAGFGFSSWASEIPRVRAHLHISPAQLGLLLLAASAGSVTALPMTGLVVQRLGEARTVAFAALLMATGLATIAIGYRYDIAIIAVGLFGFGVALGSWDVAMNVQGAAVEREMRRSVMSKFHAGYSIGTVAGAGIGVLVIAAGVPVTAHLLGAAVLLALVVPISTRQFLASGPQPSATTDDVAASSRQWAVWKEPRTLLIGLFVLCLAFTEGTGNDWLSSALIDGYHEPAAIGTLTLSVFLAAMTTGRWFGPQLLDRYGRVLTLRYSAAMAAAGLVLVVFGSVLAVAMVGAVLWGFGAALGFPTGMSAAADDPSWAASRVSVVASIGYLAFLGGPPIIGLVGDHVGVLRALLVGAGLLVVGVLIAGATAPETGLRDAPVTSPDPRA
jgi:predicted MFS family arabinose efflux permease